MNRTEPPQPAPACARLSAEVSSIVERHGNELGALIAVLQDVQARWGYLPEDVLRLVAGAMNRSLVDIVGVATFYRSFSLKPRGKHVVSVCTGTACHVRGAPMIVGEFQRQLKVGVGETTPDREFTLETVNCVGACALGPIVVADGRTEANVGTAAVKKVLKKARGVAAGTAEAQDPSVFPVDVSCARCNHLLMDPQFQIDGRPSIRVTIAFSGLHGWLRLSSLYGSYQIACEYEVPQDIVADFFCPHCHAELRCSSACAACGAPMIPMNVRGGGIVQICARRGCKGHMLDLTGVNL